MGRSRQHWEELGLGCILRQILSIALNFGPYSSKLPFCTGKVSSFPESSSASPEDSSWPGDLDPTLETISDAVGRVLWALEVKCACWPSPVRREKEEVSVGPQDLSRTILECKSACFFKENNPEQTKSIGLPSTFTLPLMLGPKVDLGSCFRRDSTFKLKIFQFCSIGSAAQKENYTYRESNLQNCCKGKETIGKTQNSLL